MSTPPHLSSCCVDEVAAEHQDADSVIHFGHTCLSPTRRLPVRYVYGRWAVDVDHCAQSMSALIKDELGPALLVYDLHYHYAAGEVLVTFYFVVISLGEVLD